MVIQFHLCIAGKIFAAERELEGFSQVNRSPSGGLKYLLTAAKSIGDDQRVRLGAPHCRQKDAVPDCLRQGELLPLKSEWPGHTATAGIDRPQIRAHLPKQRLFVVHLHESFVVAMTMEQNFSGKMRSPILRCVMFQEFAEKESLAP